MDTNLAPVAFTKAYSDRVQWSSSVISSFHRPFSWSLFCFSDFRERRKEMGWKKLKTDAGYRGLRRQVRTCHVFWVSTVKQQHSRTKEHLTGCSVGKRCSGVLIHACIHLFLGGKHIHFVVASEVIGLSRLKVLLWNLWPQKNSSTASETGKQI